MPIYITTFKPHSDEIEGIAKLQVEAGKGICRRICSCMWDIGEQFGALEEWLQQEGNVKSLNQGDIIEVYFRPTLVNGNSAMLLPELMKILVEKDICMHFVESEAVVLLSLSNLFNRDS